MSVVGGKKQYCIALCLTKWSNIGKENKLHSPMDHEIELSIIHDSYNNNIYHKFVANNSKISS